MRLHISHIKSTTFGIRKAFKSVYSEIDDLKAELAELKEQRNVEDQEEEYLLSKENYVECEDKDSLFLYAESIGIKISKNSGIEKIKKEIEVRLQGE